MHQGPLDDLYRRAQLLPRLLGVGVDEVGDALHHRVGEALLNALLTPLEIRLLLGCALPRAAVLLRDLKEPVSRVWAGVEDDVLDPLAELRGQIVIDGQLPGVYDAHVHAVLDGMVEEHRVNRLPHRVVAAEGERDIGDASRDERMRESPLDLGDRVDEVLRVVVVLGYSGSDGEDVRIEDDVLCREADG